jgi:hypothetical protein
MRRGVLALVFAATACAPRHVPPPPALPAPPGPGLTVTLHWTAPADLDLYVTDPVLETVYFANPRTRSGGVLERDARCTERTGDYVERARWTAPPLGRYRVGVDFITACSAADDAAYSLTVDVNGVRQAVAGRAHLSVREPAVLEFIVAAPPAGEVR